MNVSPHQGPDLKNLALAIVMATAIMFSWQYFYERPRLAALEVQQEKERAAKKLEEKTAPEKIAEAQAQQPAHDTAPRITINTPALHGSFSVVGARLDDITLARYKETQAADAPEVKLLNRASEKEAYFAEFGLLSDGSIRLPDANTHWKTNDTELAVGAPVTLTWSNGEGLTFERKIEVDEHYMFTITTRVRNEGAAVATLYPYGLISRNYADSSKHTFFMHEGPLGVVNGALEDMTYEKLRDDGAQSFTDTGGWVGITDKYWLTAIIPDKDEKFDAEFKHFTRGKNDAYQTNLRGKPMEVPVGKEAVSVMRFFAGAKVVSQLDAYRDHYSIPLFDRAVDFGSLYFLTRPIFSLLSYFHGIVGNFGIAILLLTVVIKLLLFPLAHKSMTSMARMKQLTPKMTELRERFKDDKMRANQEIIALYKREKVNPVSGCLPILLQLPIFIALYRVLFVTIEMRHAPFYGWIKDLSVVDPTNIFTLFGIIPWDAPSFLHIGVWPLVMCVTMVIQQKLNPKPADEIQAAMMNWMPYVFLFMFASFPAGLVIYWVANNTFSILQQLYINTHLTKKGLR